ncbi:hypothetical protein HID58_022267 [Brassica napus]|uniref:Replication factor A C-terminal domain-containing protein n=2 Tax=Brassica TaxID=3705 RepID=A0ABQ8CYV2_BRANA|nr:hypothetical protein HID58_022267 [Brassica napus]
MTTAVSPVANAVVARSTFNSLRLGRTSQFVVGRLIRFWDSRNIKKNGEFMGITILLLDELLPDVVGEIRSVQGSDLRNDAATTRVVVRLLIEPDVTVYLSLWDEAASTFRGLLKAGDKTKSVMLVTTVIPKLFGGSDHLLPASFQSGNMYLNSTPGTRFFFDTSLPEIATFVSMVGGESSKVFPLVDTLQGIKKKELVSIADLNTFISNSNEQTQEADFFCKARIVGVVHENGWSFVACTGCNRKLERIGTSLSCNRCVTDAVTGVVRFRVELAVDDGNDSATFVVFDKEMTKLTQQDAAVLALDEAANGGEENLPICLEELTDKEFVFQIRVTPFNFTPNHRTFTVSTITEDIISLTHGKVEEDENILGGNEGDSGLKAPPSGPSVLGENVGEECGTTDPPEIAVTRNNRKRSRHPEAAYLFGILLMCFGKDKKGKKVINNLAETKGITVVEDCWDTVQTALSGFTLSMRDVYLKSYENVQPEINCHPDELNTACSKCFHFFLVSEFIEMIMGLNNIVNR